MIKWQVNVWSQKISREFDSLIPAKIYAQQFSESELIKWYVERNLPNLKPDLVYRSLSLFTWNGKWKGTYIHGPYNGTYEEDPS